MGHQVASLDRDVSNSYVQYFSSVLFCRSDQIIQVPSDAPANTGFRPKRLDQAMCTPDYCQEMTSTNASSVNPTQLCTSLPCPSIVPSHLLMTPPIPMMMMRSILNHLHRGISNRLADRTALNSVGSCRKRLLLDARGGSLVACPLSGWYTGFEELVDFFQCAALCLGNEEVDKSCGDEAGWEPDVAVC